MTREEAIEVIEQDIPCEHDRDLIEALEMAISALSADGEYIKKEEIINHLAELGWISDEPFNEVSIPKEVFDEVPTYSFPDSAKNKDSWIPVTERLPEDLESFKVSHVKKIVIDEDEFGEAKWQ